jgi:hypothetical protein
MRRSIWLAAGVVLGIVGYRRLDRASKIFASQLRTPLPPVRQAPGTTSLPAARPGSAIGLAAGAAAWAAARVRTRRAAGRAQERRLAAFAGEVRAGMAEYLERHEADLNRQQARSGNTLVDQRATGHVAAGRPLTGAGLSIAGSALGPGPDQFLADSDKTKDGR